MNHVTMISLGLLVMCFLIRIPTIIGMTISSIFYLAVKGMDPNMAMEIFASKIYNDLILLAVPLFISAVNVMNSGKVTDKIFDSSKILVEQWRDGLGYVDVTASLVFPRVTDSAAADAPRLGTVGIEAMRKEGYDNDFSAAITAGSAVIGSIFLPSIPLVMYGVIADASIGNLFLAGMVSGIMLALALCIYVYYIANKRNYPSGGKYVGMEFIRMMVSAVPAFLTPIILSMGIYTGIMTATEAGAVAALYVPLIPAFVYRLMASPEFIQVLRNMVKSTEQIGIMLGAAYVLSYVIAVENLPPPTGNLILSFATAKITSLIFVNITLLILDMLLDSVVLQLVLLPISCPIVQSLGIDIVHFGVVFMFNAMIRLYTPLFGMLLFIVTEISEEKMNTIIEEVMPMVLVMVLVLILATFMPDVIMWLPRLFGR